MTLAAVLGAAPAAQAQNLVQTPEAVFSRVGLANLASLDAVAAEARPEGFVPT